MRSLMSVDLMQAVRAASLFDTFVNKLRPPIYKGYRRRNTTQHTPNGLCECERRRRQIANGQLRYENGVRV